MKTLKISEKIYSPDVATKISWAQTMPYQLGDGNKDFPFAVTMLSDTDEVLETLVVNVPATILNEWDDDTIITNYLMSHLGLTVRNDDTVNLLVSKVNGGTINFADGVDAVEAQTILNNYVQFVALSIESFNRGEIDLVNFPTIEQYNPTVQVVINLGTEVFSVLEFAQTIQAAAPAEKQSKLTDCLTNITQL
jgi:hypothetical protein